jgi:hypothetical protein
MKDFQKIDWKIYNRPPYYQQWLCRDDTLKLATFDESALADIDDQALALKDQWNPDDVKGYFLDRIGKIFVEPRKENNDELYRLILKLRVLLNTTDGTVNDVIKVIKFLYGSEEVHIQPNYPAGISILHDGEARLKDFNSILVQVIAAGVAYDTKELFNFLEKILLSDSADIRVVKNDTERFGRHIKHNDLIKRDGHTINDMIWVKSKYDGTRKHDGTIKHNGRRKATPDYSVQPTFKYSSRTADLLGTVVRFGGFEDTVEAADSFFLGMRYHHKRDGSRRYDGSIHHDSTVLKVLMD